MIWSDLRFECLATEKEGIVVKESLETESDTEQIAGSVAQTRQVWYLGTWELEKGLYGQVLGNSAVSVPLPSDHLNVREAPRAHLWILRGLKHSAEADGLYLPKADWLAVWSTN